MIFMSEVTAEGLAGVGNWGFIIFLILILLVFGLGFWGVS